MGLITPPGMEEYRGFFRIFVLIIVAVFAYRNFTFSPPEAKDETVKEQPGHMKANRKEQASPAPKDPNSEPLLRVQKAAPSDEMSPAFPAFSGLNDWTNSKIKQLAETSEGKILVNALAQIAMERNAGIKDLSLILAEATDTADYRDIKVGTGARAQCGAKVRIHTDISHSSRITVLNTEKLGAPLDIRVGDNSVLPGIERLLPDMRVGGKRIMGIPSALAYDDPSFHNSLVVKGQAVFATVTLLSAEPTPLVARQTVSTMPTITTQEEHTTLFCGMRVKAAFYRGKDTSFPKGGVSTPAFTLGQPEEDIPPIALHAALHRQRHGIAETYTAVENTATAAYVNSLLYLTEPQERPVFTVALYHVLSSNNEEAYDFLGDDFELPVELDQQ